jgi:hypothetical protein
MPVTFSISVFLIRLAELFIAHPIPGPMHMGMGMDLAGSVAVTVRMNQAGAREQFRVAQDFGRRALRNNLAVL